MTRDITAKNIILAIAGFIIFYIILGWVGVLICCILIILAASGIGTKKKINF